MAANDYLKIAAAQLRRAAKALQIQSSQMLSEQTRVTTQKNFEISKHEIDLKADHVALSQQKASRDSNPRYEAELLMSAKMLERKISAKKDEVRKISEQFTNIARAKQKTADGLLGQARNLESQASSPMLSS